MLGFNSLLDRWKHRILSYAGNTELRDHLVRGTLNYYDFQLTAAQMDALNATPVEVLPAPGAGLVNIPMYALTKIVAGSTAFELGTGVLEFRYTDGSGAKPLADVPNASLEAAQNTTVFYNSIAASVAPVSNAKVVAKASADVTAGNGTVYGRIWYLTIKTAELA